MQQKNNLGNDRNKITFGYFVATSFITKLLSVINKVQIIKVLCLRTGFALTLCESRAFLHALKTIVSLTMFCLPLATMPVQAQIDAKKKGFNFNQQLEQLRKAEKATVFLSIPYTGHISYSYTKATTQLFTCHYISSKQDDIESLVRLLQRAEIQQISEVKSHIPIVGTFIYFTLTDGREAEILLGREYVNEDILDGVITTPSSNAPITILANNTNHRLQRDLYHWAANAEEIRAGNYYYQPKVIDEIQRQWIFRDAALFGKSGTDALQEMEILNKHSQQDALRNQLSLCKGIPAVNYYRNDETQICKAKTEGLPIPYSGESHDFCATGWESAK